MPLSIDRAGRAHPRSGECEPPQRGSLGRHTADRCPLWILGHASDTPYDSNTLRLGRLPLRIIALQDEFGLCTLYGLADHRWEYSRSENPRVSRSTLSIFV